MTHHRTTDPACRLHQPPRTLLERWRYRRGRGKPCPVCATVHNTIR